jgi:hypothetical protein
MNYLDGMRCSRAALLPAMYIQDAAKTKLERPKLTDIRPIGARTYQLYARQIKSVPALFSLSSPYVSFMLECSMYFECTWVDKAR